MTAHPPPGAETRGSKAGRQAQGSVSPDQAHSRQGKQKASSRECWGEGLGKVHMSGCEVEEMRWGEPKLQLLWGRTGLRGLSRPRNYPSAAMPRPTIQPRLGD
jgi:hypothetical protein